VGLTPAPTYVSELDRRAANILDLVEDGVLTESAGQEALAKLWDKGKGPEQNDAEQAAPGVRLHSTL
jgi:hypothetical protein